MTKTLPCVLTVCLALPTLLPAQTRNAAQISKDKILKVHPLPLESVRLMGGPLKNAQDLDAKYLLELEPDRMLAFLRQRRGAGAQSRRLWRLGRRPGQQLTGHIAGHYLSAVSLMYAATGDARFKERADYIVNELKEIQDKAGATVTWGRCWTKTGGMARSFSGGGRGNIRSGGFDLNGLWSPWYVEHKIFAGLRDAYRYTGNRDGAGSGNQVRRLGRRNSVQAQRRPDPADAEHRVRRHERSGWPTCTPTRATRAGWRFRANSNTTQSSSRWPKDRTSSPENTATRWCPRCMGR